MNREQWTRWDLLIALLLAMIVVAEFRLAVTICQVDAETPQVEAVMCEAQERIDNYLATLPAEERPVVVASALPEVTAAEPDEPEVPEWYIEAVPLAPELQRALWDACGEFGVDYHLALAVVEQETGYQNLIGDGGDSIGYFQIQPYWWGDLMEQIGVDDLTDPAQNFRTGCAVLRYLLDINDGQVDGGRAVLTIGNGLIEAKEKLNHGEWLPWLTENVGYSEKQAENYMKIARNYSNPQLVADLGMRKALALLALPKAEQESFVAEANVVDMTSRELEKAVRERAEALADKSAAEAARAKMAEDIAFIKEQLAGTQEERDQATKDRDALRAELDELKSRPVEVAVEVDQAALDKVRDETRLKVEAEFKSARSEAQKQVNAANESAAQVKTELQQARREIDNLKFELNRAGGASPLSADADLAQFKLLFDQAQGIVNQLHGLLIKARKREDSGVAGKLEAALTALSEKVRGCVQ